MKAVIYFFMPPLLLLFFGFVLPCTDGVDLEVFIIGGTGDLAKRYLWNGFFKIFQEEHPSTKMRFSGAGKSEISNAAFRRILLHSIACSDGSSSDARCAQERQDFIARSRYERLQSEVDYQKICTTINSNSSSVIFYLSVPPVAYEKIIKCIVNHCNVSNPRKDFKFVFEKPFGTDFHSATSLARMLRKYLSEAQIFRVDHYLGKETVHRIEDFREKNPQIERMLNARHVKRIHISVTETIGCEGRAGYYDKSGVIRDMLQSHLTEVLCLITKNIGAKDSRLHLLKNITTVEMKDILLSQYSGARLHIHYPRWAKVPIRLTSGKKLKERNGYARIVFKRNSFKPNPARNCQMSSPQLIFVIRHSKLKTPAVFVSRSLPLATQYAPPGWVRTTRYNNVTVFGDEGKCYFVFAPYGPEEDAYSHLIKKLYEGNRGDFLPMDTLLESWRIWSHIVEEVDYISDISTYAQRSSVRSVTNCMSNALIMRSFVINLFLKKCDVRPMS